MGLDWIAAPYPGAEMMVEQQPDSEYDRVFRGQAVIDSPLPESVVNTGWTSMRPAEMRSYAAGLTAELAASDSVYDEATVKTIEAAVAWLEYWAGHEVSVTAEW